MSHFIPEVLKAPTIFKDRQYLSACNSPGHCLRFNFCNCLTVILLFPTVNNPLPYRSNDITNNNVE